MNIVVFLIGFFLITIWGINVFCVLHEMGKTYKEIEELAKRRQHLYAERLAILNKYKLSTQTFK